MTLSLLWRYGRRCGQGRLHQPGSKTDTCIISSNVAGTGSTEMPHQTLDEFLYEILASLYHFSTSTKPNEVALLYCSSSILVPVGGMC